MKILRSGLKYFIFELIILFALVFLINNYFGKEDQTIKSDGVGYYDYLPSILIHHDFVRKHDSLQANPDLYQRINATTGVYVDYKNFKVNKYTSGTALLQLPFFLVTYSMSEMEGNVNDGYQKPYQKMAFYSAVFYLALSLLFLKEVLLLYHIKKYIIVFCQLILVLATSVINYVNFDAAFSHVYSLFAITAFIYFIKLFLIHKKTSHFVIASVFLGLIFLLRQPNILIVLFIPFLAGSIENFKNVLSMLFKNVSILILSFVIFVGIISIQLVLWYLQTGDFFVYSYQGESFNFLNPHFYDILFSYKKGLYVYTPVLLIATLGVFWFAVKKQFYLFVTWSAFFIILTYILSSWWSWYYGASYGLRAYIDFYPIFIIAFALMLEGLKRVPGLILITLSLFTIPLNIIQTYQYKEFILHWIDMDKEKYWKVFLKTDDKYRGLVWQTPYHENQYTTLGEIAIGDVIKPKNTAATVFSVKSNELPYFDKVAVIQVVIDHDFEESNDSRVILAINSLSENHNYYWHEIYLIHFHQKELNGGKVGRYNFEFVPITDQQEKEISLGVNIGDKDESFKNVRLRFLAKNGG